MKLLNENISIMNHQGKKLEGYAKNKGLNMSELADIFELSHTAIIKHFASPVISRKVLKRYADYFGFDVDAFYKGEIVEKAESVKPKEDNTVSMSMYLELQAKYIDLQAKYIDLQERFFPNAPQRHQIQRLRPIKPSVTRFGTLIH